MGNSLIPLGLGSGKIRQTSISEPVDQNLIEDIFLKNIEEIEKYLSTSNDEFEKEIFFDLKKNKKIKFIINKHLELYILSHQKNIIKIFKYLVFRYKFLKCGREKINLGYPPYLLIEPVSTCNLRCPFCFQTDPTFTKKPYMGVMNFELFKKIADEANILGVGAVTMASRGEPTLHKNFAEMLDYIGSKENIFEIKINTNATFLNDKISHSIFKNNIAQIVISADHYQKEEYERLRKNSNYEKILKNVDNLFEIRKKYYPNSTSEIRISGIDSDKTLNREKFKNFWLKRSDHVTASFALERWNTYENTPHSEINDPCENLWDRLYVWFDGKVNPCDADYKSYLSYGNLKDKSIKDIWNNQIIKKLRDEHLKKLRNKSNPCDRCGVTFV
jgi:radical SAM protein with 4Fe4S-binding SPASM domain